MKFLRNVLAVGVIAIVLAGAVRAMGEEVSGVTERIPAGPAVREAVTVPAPSAFVGGSVLMGLLAAVRRGSRKPDGMGPLGLHHGEGEYRDSYTL